MKLGRGIGRFFMFFVSSVVRGATAELTNCSRSVVRFVLLSAIVVIGGCRPQNEVSRLPVHGTVTTANGEKPNGSISFIPADGESGPAAMTVLTGGNYQFDRTNGPTAGPHQVIVRKMVSHSRTPPSGAGDFKNNSVKTADTKAADNKTVPKTEWRLTANLSEHAANQYDFTLPP
jgi:hypothetical protein